jgi:RNA polymerase sigma-70 factor (sigma-E family)
MMGRPSGDGAGTGSDLGDFEAFVAARAAGLVRVARGMLRDPHHAEDVVQEVLVAVHRKWDVVVATSVPDAYVRRMLVNACTSFWRRAARRELAFSELPFAEPGPAHWDPGPASGIDDREVMLSVLRRLPPRQRAALVLRHYEGLDDTEIAAAMGTTVMTVRSQVHRGIAAMRMMMAREEETQR